MERRVHYRVSAKRLGTPSVMVLPAHGTPLEGRILDMSAAGAGVRIDHSRALDLPVGSRVVLALGGSTLDAPLTVDAVARFQITEDGSVRWGFQFQDPETFLDNLPPHLGAVFNERHMLRVTPDPNDPVGLWLRLRRPGQIEKARLPAQLCDLSALGLCAEVAIEIGSGLNEDDRVDFELGLPGAATPVPIVGHVRYRLPLGDVWRVGIETDAQQTPNAAAVRAEVVAYVMSRQDSLNETSGLPLTPLQGSGDDRGQK